MLEVAVFHTSRHEQVASPRACVEVCEGALNGEALESLDDPQLNGIAFEAHADPDDANRIRIANHGHDFVLPWHDKALRRNQSLVVELPVQIRREGATIEIRSSRGIVQAGRSFHTIPRSRSQDGRPLVDVKLLGLSPGPETLASWLESLGTLSRSAAGSQQLLVNTAKAVCQPGGMNGALIILRDEEDWQIKASHLPNPELGVAYARDLLEQVAEHGQTHFHDASEDLETSSRTGSDSVTAAPIFGADDDVVGVVYGIRSLRGANQRRGVRPLEALWIQLLAESVSNSLLRMQAEAEAARNRVMLEQVFSDQVVEQLLNNPDILESHDREVTALFADLRGYSVISQQIGPKATHQLLSEILEHLTNCIAPEDGVIIDYYGDGLAAMWNAPSDQADHPLRACRAAIAMQAGLVDISHQWKSVISKPLRLGIGIHSGIAQVGNSGTKTRLKYGPRGHTVVIASRLESATRRTKAGILISSEVKATLPSAAVTRRICRATLPGIKDPLELYELLAMDERRLERKILNRIDIYEKALALTEAEHFDEAEALLQKIADRSDSAPSGFLASQLNLPEPLLPNLHAFDLTTIKT